MNDAEFLKPFLGWNLADEVFKNVYRARVVIKFFYQETYFINGNC